MAQSGIEKWTQKIEDSEKRYLQRFRKLKEQIRTDESLPVLDRAVLGATGSPEELKRYQDLARKIGVLAGQPIIKIEKTQDGKVMDADAGLIIGPVEASLDYWGGVMVDGEREFSGSILKVPVSPSVVYMKRRGTTICSSGREQEMFFDEQNSLYDREEKISRIEIARIWPIKSWEQSYSRTTEPSQDFEHRIPFESVLVGREAIYASSHFSEGVSEILLALEKFPSEESQPELKLAS